MTQEEKIILKAAIIKKVEFAKEDIEEYKKFTQPVSPDSAIGRISRIDAMMSNSVTEGALREAETRLQKLQLALETIDRDEFGICKKCGQDIPFERMKLMPESIHCVNCGK